MHGGDADPHSSTVLLSRLVGSPAHMRLREGRLLRYGSGSPAAARSSTAHPAVPPPAAVSTSLVPSSRTDGALARVLVVTRSTHPAAASLPAGSGITGDSEVLWVRFTYRVCVYLLTGGIAICGICGSNLHAHRKESGRTRLSLNSPVRPPPDGHIELEPPSLLIPSGG